MTEIGEGVSVSLEKKEKTGSLEISVLNKCNDKPVKGAGVTIRSKKLNSDDSGKVTFDKLHPGTTPVFIDKSWPDLDFFNFLIHVPPLSTKIPKKAKSYGFSVETVEAGGTTKVQIKIKVYRKVEKVVFKRKHIDLYGDDQYGHWWVEIDDIESYGWWPKNPVGYRETPSEPPKPPPPLPENPSPLERIGNMARTAVYNARMAWYEVEPLHNQISDTLGGVEGELNGQTISGGTATDTRDYHHGDPGDEEYQPIINDCRTDEEIKACIRNFAQSYSGNWAWRFEFGQNCHSFQIDIIKHCNLKNLIKF